MFKDFLNFIYAISTLAGTIIGVGFFSLPYITLQVGFPIMVFYFLILGSLVLLVHLFFGEISLLTPDLKRFPGFAKYHLGDWGEKVAIFSSVFGILGSILAYLIVGGEFLFQIFSFFLPTSYNFWTFIYFLFGAILIFFGIKTIAKVEFFSLLLFFIILGLIFLQNFQKINILNFFSKLNFSQIFLPYGPILFSLWGAALIPEVEEILKEKKYLLKKVILISILISILIYFFFIYLILGICGKNTTETALTGLKNFLPLKMFILILIFGILTTFTSFISLGLTLKKILCYDLKIEKNLAWFLTCFVPLGLFFIGIKKFISVISFIGAILLGIDGILILLMYQKIKKKNFLIYPLFLMFAGGIFWEVFHFLK